MTAKEAKERAFLVNTGESNSQYAKIIEAIKNATEEGKYEIWFYEWIKQDVVEKLITDGYNVGIPQSDRDGEMTRIVWG